MTYTTTVTSKGQVTIPLALRQLLAVGPGDKVRFDAAKKTKKLVLKPVPNLLTMRGIFKTTKKYDKRKARKTYLREVLAGKV